MRRGLHLLGYDWTKGASSMTEALADGFSKGVAKQSATRGAGQKALTPSPSPKESNTVWYVGGAAAVAILTALLWRSR